MVNLTEVMSGGTIDAVVYIYSDGVCEVEINSYDSTDEIKDQSDDKYGLMIDNYVDAIRKFGEMKDGAIDIEFDHNMIHLPSVKNGGVEGSDVPLAGEQQQEAISESDGEEAVSDTDDNGGGDETTQHEEREVQPQDKVPQINQKAIIEEKIPSENGENDGDGGELKPGQAEKGNNKPINDDNAKGVGKLSYNQVKTYLETRPNTYTMYDLLTCKWISILNNEISPLDAVDKIKKYGDLNDTIYNPVLNAFYKVNENKKEILNHDEIKRYITDDNIRFSHFEEFWEYNNTSTKWIYGRWINGTEYKFKYDNGWLQLPA